MPKARPSTSRHSSLALGVATIAIAAVSAVVLAKPANAQESPPDPASSGVSQYVELVPTGQGPKSPGVGKKQQAPLPPKAKKALDTTSKARADALTTVATSSDYGAPTTSARPRARPRSAPSPNAEPSLAGTLEATAVAAAPLGNVRLIGLFVALVAIAAGAGAIAIRRGRAY